jgi:hypothetical protein
MELTGSHSPDSPADAHRTRCLDVGSDATPVCDLPMGPRYLPHPCHSYLHSAAGLQGCGVCHVRQLEPIAICRPLIGSVIRFLAATRKHPDCVAGVFLSWWGSQEKCVDQDDRASMNNSSDGHRIWARFDAGCLKAWCEGGGPRVGQLFLGQLGEEVLEETACSKDRLAGTHGASRSFQTRKDGDDELTTSTIHALPGLPLAIYIK